MEKIINPVKKINGTIEIPGDKSISHRALILGSMCEGIVNITNLSTGDDCNSTIACLKKLGVKISRDGITSIEGKGLSGFQEPADILDAQNSGTTIRLLVGLLAGQPFYTVLTGDDSLKRRPMNRVVSPLIDMGAKICGRDNNRVPPLTIIGGNLQAISYDMPIASAQVKSAILIAGMYGKGTTRIIEKHPTRDHTEKILKFLGASMDISQNTIEIASGKLTPRDIIVPGDISSAIFFIVATLLLPSSHLIIRKVGLNKTRLGALDVLCSMGASLETIKKSINNEEPCGDIIASSSKLKPLIIDEYIMPSLIDEIPILSLAATQAEGTSIISGASELRVKESDRLKAIASQLKLMGADIEEKADGLIIHGPTPLSGAGVDSFNDHRIAMMLAIAGLIADGPTTIKNADSVIISFPEFYDLLGDITRGITC